MTSPYWYFTEFRLDPDNACLWRGARQVPLTPKAFGVLHYLVTHADRLVTKDALLDAVWPATAVSDAVLKVCMREIRQALGDTARAPRFIATAHRRGYRFVAPVTRTVPEAVPPPVLPSPPLVPLRPLVGRDTVLVRLHAALAQARQGQRQVLFLIGEPGIGKTAVVDAFTQQVRQQADVRVTLGQCVERYGPGEPYLPILEALGRLCRGPQGASLAAILRQQAPTWLVQMPWLLTPTDRAHLQQELQGSTRERMLRECVMAIETCTATAPLVLVLEDLHWSDHATLDLLNMLARRRDPAQFVLLGTFRPVETIVHDHPLRVVAQALQRDGRGSVLPLDPLPVEAVTAYLRARFPEHRLPSTLALWLHQHTDGNPLFLVTTVFTLVEQGVLAERAGHWRLLKPLDVAALGVPEGVRPWLEQQIECLPAALQRVLAVASVAGVAFEAAVVAAGLEEPVAEIDAHCEALVRYQVLQPGELTHWPDGTVTTRYTFTHALYQQTAYARLGAGRRMHLHRHLGMRLEDAYGSQAADIATVLAEHFVRGHDHHRVVQYGWLAAETALSRHAHREAVTHLTRTLEALARLPESPERTQQELRGLVTLGRSLMATLGAAATEVEQTYARASTLCQHMQDAMPLLPVLAGLQRFYMVRADYQQAHALGTRLLTIAQRLHDQEFVCEGHTILGVVLYHKGQLVDARVHQEQARAMVVPQPRQQRRGLLQDVQVANLVNSARVLWCLGYAEQALDRSQAGLRRARALAEPTSIAFALLQGANLQFCGRNAAAVQAMAEELLVLTQAQEFVYWEAASRIAQGWGVAMQGDPAVGLAAMRQGVATLEAIGSRIERPVSLAMLAEGYGVAADPAAGLEVLATALAMAEDTGEHWWDAELYRLRGELLVYAGSPPAAAGQAIPAPAPAIPQSEACFQRALAIARQQQAKSLELRAAMSLARLWQQQGKGAEARELLAPLYGWFTEGLDTADLQDASALLGALA